MAARFPVEAVFTPLTMAPMLVRECIEAMPFFMHARTPMEEALGPRGSHAAACLNDLALRYEAQDR